jgi:predicted house-cleaning NTP pyrophosphatase (Maf/HAM1 superfamily)
VVAVEVVDVEVVERTGLVPKIIEKAVAAVVAAAADTVVAAADTVVAAADTVVAAADTVAAAGTVVAAAAAAAEMPGAIVTTVRGKSTLRSRLSSFRVHWERGSDRRVSVFITSSLYYDCSIMRRTFVVTCKDSFSSSCWSSANYAFN